MYARFRARFGPEVLAGLDGQYLLLKMHGRGDARDSLAYRLEFKMTWLNACAGAPFSAPIASPEDATRIFSWLIDETRYPARA